MARLLKLLEITAAAGDGILSYAARYGRVVSTPLSALRERMISVDRRARSHALPGFFQTSYTLCGDCRRDPGGDIVSFTDLEIGLGGRAQTPPSWGIHTPLLE